MRALWVSAGLLLAGCYGSAPNALSARDAPGGNAPEGPDVVVPDGPDVVPTERAEVVATFAPLRRLSQFEYERTVEALLPVTGRTFTAGFPKESHFLGFDNMAEGQNVSALLAETYYGAAESLADAAVKVPEVMACSGATPASRACAEAALTRFTRKAFRRTPTEEEVASLLALYDAAAADEGFTVGMRWALVGVFASPKFLYRKELGEGALDAHGQRLLSGAELASRLSYFLWAGPPDEQLLAAGESGELVEPAKLEAEARRMIADPRARGMNEHFYRLWLRLDELDHVAKSATLYPSFNAGLVASMKQETLTFLDELVFNRGGNVKDLLTTPTSFGDDRIAALYGLPTTGSTQPRPLSLNPTQRAGLLTQPSLLAISAYSNDTSPVHRGRFVRESLLCQMLPPPPPDVETKPPASDPNASVREKLTALTSGPACAGCHTLMNPIGFGFESYDAIGRFRTQDAFGHDIDDSGEVIAGGASSGPFRGAVGLAQKLASAPEVASCVSRQWRRFAMGRLETDEDAPALAALSTRFLEKGATLRELWVAIALGEDFRKVKPEASP